MKKLLLNSMWILFLLASNAFGQNRTITGMVTEKDEGGPLPGVSVMVKGSKTGTQSNAQGKFTISANSGQTLVFTSVGYKTQSLTVTGSTLNVVMESNQTQLSDVMVIGYGTQTRRDNVGSVAQIKGSELAELPVQNFEQALAGKAPGLQVTMANGVSNTPPVIHIRGTNSISLSSQPLFVVDGIPVFTGDLSGGESGGNALSNINPDDIESVDVAKDASATAIYGSRGANGVIFVTTKKGKKGDAVVSFDSWIGSTSAIRLPQVLDASQYIALKNEALVNSGLYNTTVTTPQTKPLAYVTTTNGANGQPINTNWESLIYRRATTYSATASVSGGTDKTSYYLSSNWSKQQGIIQKDEFDIKSMLASVDHKANKYISFGGKISYANNQNLAATSSGSLNGEAYVSAGLGRLAVLIPPNIGPYNNDGSYNLNGTSIGIMNNKGFSNSYPNPQPLLDLDRSNNELNHITGDIYLQVKPLPWIILKTVYGIDYVFTTNDAFLDPIANPPGSATDYVVNYKRSLWTNTAQFDRSFGKHNFNLLLGNEQQFSNVRSFGITRTTLSDPAFNVIQAGYTTNSYAAASPSYADDYLVSFFGRLNYNFNEKYFLSASLRHDGFSGFGSDKKYGYFPGLGLAWEITKEDFWKNIGADKVFSSFKLKTSWGRTGNNGVGAYPSYGFYGTSVFNTNGTLLPTQTGNNSLAWETSTKSDAGLQFGILNDRITAEISYYYNDITGLLLTVPSAPSAGLASNPLVNVGTMFNRGLELNIDANIIHSKGFTWDANFNISYNQNKITALAPGQNSITYSTSSLEIANINQVGYSVGDLYIVRSAGVDPATGQRIFINGKGQKEFYSFPTNSYTFADGSKAPAITQAADAVNYANAVPKEIGGLSNTFRYKNFDFSFLFTFQLGFDVYYGTGATLTDQRFFNNSTAILNHWTAPGQNAKYPKVYFGDNVSNGTSFPTDFNTYSGNFLRLRSINLGYTLPKTWSSKVGLSSLRFYVTGQNLLLFTKYPGDPEISSNGASAAGNSTPGVDRNTSGTSRAVTAGMLVKF